METRKLLFKLKHFDVLQTDAVMKVGTDGLLLGAWVDVDGKKNALDIGTGTGLIPLMMAQRNAKLKVVGIDIDEPSAALAKENFEGSKFREQLSSIALSVQEYQSEALFDLIVTNPPFFSGGTLSDNSDRNRMRQTTKLSHQDLLSNVKRLLAPEGSFSLILPPLEGLRFVEMAYYFNLHCTRITEVYPRATQPVKRLLLNFGRHQPNVIIRDSFEIDKGSRNDWTDDYISLTKNYHPNL